MTTGSEARYLRPGDPLPDLTLPTLDGGAVALRGLAGKQTVLFIWASW